MRLFSASVLILLCSMAIATCPPPAASTVLVGSEASRLTLSETAIPPLQVPHYKTSGTVPQVSGGRTSLSAVNANLRRAIVKDEENYAPSARQAVEENQDGGSDGEGIYETSPIRTLMSASTVVVSVLIPTEKLYPLGNDGAEWISTTVRVPSGSPVSFLDLFSNPSGGLKTLARVAGIEAWKGNPCLRTPGYKTFVDASFWRHPTVSTFETYALTPRGLSVGFPNGEFGAEACGRIAVTVPYATMRPYLSSLARRLISGVRQPRF
jgi:hypothetical protein